MKHLPNKDLRTYVTWAILLASVLMALYLVPKVSCDGDFPRHLVAGEHIFQEHNFPPPGPGKYFPWMDIFVGFLYQLTGTYISVGITSLVTYILCMILFYLIIKEYEVDIGKLSKWVLLGLVFGHPVILIAGGTRGDYIYSLFWVLLSWYLVLKDSAGLAGLAIAMASGFRVNNAMWVLPLMVLYQRRFGMKRMVEFTVVAAVAGYLVWHGVFIRGGSLNPLVVLKGADTYSGHLPFLKSLKSGISKFTHLVGIPVVILTAAFYKNIDWGSWKKNILKMREILLAFGLLLLSFMLMSYELGYLITILPVLALLYPPFRNPNLDVTRVALVFSINFFVIGLQFQVPSKLVFSHGYYVSEATCHRCDTFFQKFRFSIPRNKAGQIIYPAGDWAIQVKNCD